MLPYDKFKENKNRVQLNITYTLIKIMAFWRDEFPECVIIGILYF